MALSTGDRFGFTYQGQYETAEIISANNAADGSGIVLELRMDSGITITEQLSADQADEMNIADLESYLSHKYEGFEC